MLVRNSSDKGIEVKLRLTLRRQARPATKELMSNCCYRFVHELVRTVESKPMKSFLQSYLKMHFSSLLIASTIVSVKMSSLFLRIHAGESVNVIEADA